MLVAVLEDDKARCTEMERSLRLAVPDISFEFFDNAPDMMAWLARHIDEVALVSLAYDLGPSRLRDGMLFNPGTGRNAIDFLVEMDGSFPVIVHAANNARGQSMLSALESAGWPSFRVKAKDGLDWIDSRWSPRVVEVLRELENERN